MLWICSFLSGITTCESRGGTNKLLWDLYTKSRDILSHISCKIHKQKGHLINTLALKIKKDLRRRTSYISVDGFILIFPNWRWHDHKNKPAVRIHWEVLGPVSLVRVNWLYNVIFSHQLLSRLFIFLLFLQDVRDTPHYRILINKANGFGKSTTYIPEEEITIIMGLEVVFIFIPLQLACYPLCLKVGWPLA